MGERFPKGVYVRNSISWFQGKSAWVGGAAVGGGGHPPAICLFNNAQSGEAFEVYGLAVQAAGVTAVYIDTIGGKVGSASNVAKPLVAGQGSPPGQIFAGAVANPADITVQPFQQNVGSPFSTLFAEFPLWVIPVGMSLYLFTTGATDVLAATFWYLAINRSNT